jgi:hypothetical protein
MLVSPLSLLVFGLPGKTSLFLMHEEEAGVQHVLPIYVIASGRRRHGNLLETLRLFGGKKRRLAMTADS